jgi:hypothetical protein
MPRCPWATTEPNISYHDQEWGVPVHDDRVLFEFVILEGAQAGLSWTTILKKRENYRKAFDGFRPEKIARYRKRDGAAEKNQQKEMKVTKVFVISPKLDLRFLRVLAKAFGVVFCKIFLRRPGRHRASSQLITRLRATSLRIKLRRSGGYGEAGLGIRLMAAAPASDAAAVLVHTFPCMASAWASELV